MEHTCNKEREIWQIQTNLNNMQKDISEIKVMIKDWFRDIKEEIVNTYATKESLESVKEKVSDHTKVIWTIWLWVVWWMSIFIWKLITDMIWK